MKILTYSLDLVLSNEYLEVIMSYLELEIFNEKVAVLFDFFILKNKNYTFLINIPSSRNDMMTGKYLFDRTKSRL